MIRLLAALLIVVFGHGVASAEPRVRVAVSAQAEAHLGLRAALAPYDWIEVVGEGAPAELRADAAMDVAQLVASAQRAWLGALANPASGLALDFTVEREGGSPEDGPVRVVEPGADLRWEARNRGEDPIWVIVFALSPDRGVSQIYPFRGRPKALRSGDTLDQRGSVDLPEGERTATDVLKLVATTKPVDPTPFLDPARLSEGFAALGRSDWRTARYELTVRREVVEIVAEPARGHVVDPIEVGGEPSAPDALSERRPAVRRRPRVVYFGVHYEADRELGAVQTALAKLRKLCGRGGAACRVRRSFPGSGVFELERMGRRLREGRSQTVGSAFEQAYEIREGLEASRVEPYLELEMPGPVDGAADATGGERVDDAWQLTHVRARDAWAEVRRARGRGEGREAEGIRVALVDTGYRPHPELFDGAGAAPPVRAAAGWDFVDGDADALDPLVHGSREQPASGTATASLLASPTGCQLGGQSGCVHGVARGAELAPLRTRRAPSHFHAGRLARVIRDAATGALPEPVDLVAVSMGGPPGWTLWRAARLAERRGLLVVAPAGEDVGTVLWPARFPSAIAVAASDGGCQPWERAAGGAAVDVAAPGAGLWRATVDGQRSDVNAIGSGSAFAAALTSGAAALWLARWRGDERLAELRRRGLLVAAFRESLRGTAWLPSHAPAGAGCPRSGFDAAFAPGILDAAALLKRPPKTQGAVASAELGMRDLPLFRSLYERRAAGRAEPDYRGLFGLAPDADLERVAYLEAEVLHHYTMTREVTAAIDALVSSATPADRFARTRRALLRQGLSADLREALRNAAGPTPGG